MRIEYLKIYSWMLQKFSKSSVAMIYALIYQHYEASLECAMSYEELAEELNITKMSTIRAVKELEQNGVIRVKRTFEKDGSNAINVYSIIQ